MRERDRASFLTVIHEFLFSATVAADRRIGSTAGKYICSGLFVTWTQAGNDAVGVAKLTKTCYVHDCTQHISLFG